eukprot:5177698-Alexandrium_andersonii.AAC.1
MLSQWLKLLANGWHCLNNAEHRIQSPKPASDSVTKHVRSCRKQFEAVFNCLQAVCLLVAPGLRPLDT